MSACFNQFDALYEISKSCRQVLFSSHWYGFLPTIESGSVTVISKSQGGHKFDVVNLLNYREQVKQMSRESRKSLPYDIRLKSINDLVQSVITSSIGENPFSWLICEGSSERIYLNAYYEDLVRNKRLRIVPVGGAREIKRLYNYLSTPYEDLKDEITGRIILLSDTDSQLVRYETKEYEKLICKRIVNCDTDKETKLVSIDANPVSPQTEVEHALNGKIYLESLRSFIDNDEHPLSFLLDLDMETTSEKASFFSLDLRQSEWEKIDTFLDKNNNKFEIANRYIKIMTNGEYQVPKWIREIREMLE
ncbi:MAG: hypothetical protein ACON4T_07705 [Synechococcus sp.]